MAGKLIFAIPKGRILDEALPLMRAAGIEPGPDFFDKNDMFDLLVSAVDFIQMNEEPEILVREIKDFSIFSPKNAFCIPSDVLKSSPELLQESTKIKSLYAEEKFQDCLKLLENNPQQFNGIPKVEMLKLKAFIFFQQNEISKARQTLLEAITILKEKIGSSQKV